MIAVPDGGRLAVVLHDDHQRQAAVIAAAWGNATFAAAPSRAIAAAGAHDAGWRSWDAQPELSPHTGRPLQFLELGATLPRLHRAGVAAAVRRDPYVGLLVSMHTCGVLGDRNGWDDPHAGAEAARRVGALRGRVAGLRFRGARRRFRCEQRMLRALLRARCRGGWERAEAWRAYDLLQAWDELSLALILDAVEDRTIGPPPARDGRAPALPALRLRRTAPHAAALAPWPFAHSRLDLPVRVRYIPDRRYRDGTELAAALAEAPDRLLACALQDAGRHQSA